MKNINPVIALITLLTLAGCQGPPGTISSTTTSVIGLKASYQGYGVIFGVIRETFQVVPTSTNAMFAPMVNSSLSLDQKAFSTSVDEDFQTGGATAPPNSVAKMGAIRRGTKLITTNQLPARLESPNQ